MGGQYWWVGCGWAGGGRGCCRGSTQSRLAPALTTVRPVDVSPEDASPEDASPEDASPGDASPGDGNPEDPVPEDDSSEEASPVALIYLNRAVCQIQNVC